MSNSALLYFNAALYVLTFFLYQYKKKAFDIGSFVLLLYSVSACVAIDLFKYAEDVIYVSIGDLTLFPFVYLYICLMLLFLPLLKFSDKKMGNFPIENNKLLNVLTYYAIIIYIFDFATTSFEYVSLSQLFSPEVLSDSYQETLSRAYNSEFAEAGFLERFFSIQKGALQDIILILFVYNLLLKRKWQSLLLLVCLFFDFYFVISTGQRFGLMKFILVGIFFYLILGKMFSGRTKKIIKYFFGSLVLVVLIAFAATTFGRFGDRDIPILPYLESYFSQAFIVFDNYGLDAGGLRYGDYTFPLGRRLLGLDYTKTIFESVDKFFYMKTDASVFNSVVGDFSLDFGPIITFVLFVGFYLFFKKTTFAPETYGFHHLLMFLVLWNICTFGFVAFYYFRTDGNIRLLLNLVVYFLLSRKFIVKRF